MAHGGTAAERWGWGGYMYPRRYPTRRRFSRSIPELTAHTGEEGMVSSDRLGHAQAEKGNGGVCVCVCVCV